MKALHGRPHRGKPAAVFDQIWCIALEGGAVTDSVRPSWLDMFFHIFSFLALVTSFLALFISGLAQRSLGGSLGLPTGAGEANPTLTQYSVLFHS